jgi:hypothetical protein
MYEDRGVVPRQIYASTVTRRDRRWTSRRRGRGMAGFAVVSLATLLAALTVIAALAPSLT